MKKISQLSTESGKVHVKFFWLASIIISIVLTVIINLIIFIAQQ